MKYESAGMTITRCGKPESDSLLHSYRRISWKLEFFLPDHGRTRYLPQRHSSFWKVPFSWHWGHFWGLQRPSFENPQFLHFQTAIAYSFLLRCGVADRSYGR